MKTACQERPLFLSYGGKNGVKIAFLPVFGFSAVFFSKTTEIIFLILFTPVKRMTVRSSCENRMSRKVLVLELWGQKRGKNAILPGFPIFSCFSHRLLERSSWDCAHRYQGQFLTILRKLHVERRFGSWVMGRKRGKKAFFTRFLDLKQFLSRTTPTFFLILCTQVEGTISDHPVKTKCQKSFYSWVIGAKTG